MTKCQQDTIASYKGYGWKIHMNQLLALVQPQVIEGGLLNTTNY